MRIVIAAGGNALLQRHQKPHIAIQKENIKIACQAITELAVRHQVIITHGNGPQVGLLALQAAAYKAVGVYPFDVLGAESQGMIGYFLAQELKNQLPKKNVVVLLTQVEVEASDPAFTHPDKFVGPTYTKAQADHLSTQNKWYMKQDGKAFRRVVPSPLPKNIIEFEAITSLLEKNFIIICAGGGGIPVIRNNQGKYTGIEAVIDKDYTSALLAEQLSADRLMLLTDVPFVMENWQTENEKPIHIIKPDELEKLPLARGSMKPKVTAACQFVRNTQKIAHIGLLADADRILQQKTGTTILSAGIPVRMHAQ
jgi:carbamate kinase